jgi:hypothetical protein
MGDILMLQEMWGAGFRRCSPWNSCRYIQKMEQNTTENAEATKLTCAGVSCGRRRPHQSLEEAVTEFQKAVRLDPKYALAYVGLADT